MVTLYNTLTRQKEELKPIRNKKVGLYTCGPTVYNFAHIGNLRTYVFEDLLKRILQYNGYKVKHIMNITDVGHLTSDADEGEDKMEKGAKREGKTAWEIAEFYAKAFKENLDDLHITPPDKWVKATEHIKEQIKLVQMLIDKNFTYETQDGIYFDTTKLNDYGKLANLKNQELKPGARIGLGEKRNPHDFALWKFSPHGEKRQMEWKAFGRMGFPGWHIECSAMAAKYLGQPFDIHCGGIDHIPVHHTNEIAQSEVAFDKPLANIWMHGEFLLISNQSTGVHGKMAKSEGNFITLQTIEEKGLSPLVYRYFLLQTHYRRQLNFSWEALQASQSGLEHLYDAVLKLKHTQLHGDRGVVDRFFTHINDDLDVPQALGVIWSGINEGKVSYDMLLDFDRILGLNFKKLKERDKIKIPRDIKKLLDQRAKAREQKDWAESDRLRDEISKFGFQVEDTSEGQKVTKSF